MRAGRKGTTSMGAQLSPRQRVGRAIRHQEVDRVPVDLGSSGVTGISVQAYSRLVDYLGLNEATEELSAIWQLAWPSEEVLRRLAVDTRGVFGRTPEHLRERFLGPDRFVDEWESSTAVRRTSCTSTSRCTRCEMPISKTWRVTPGRILFIRKGWQEQRSWQRPSTVPTSCQLAPRRQGTSLFERSWYLRGFEQFLVDLILNKQFVHRLLEILLDLQLKRWARLDEIGSYLDVIVIGDELAGSSEPWCRLSCTGR